jgi:hypothetical protein
MGGLEAVLLFFAERVMLDVLGGDELDSFPNLT